MNDIEASIAELSSGVTDRPAGLQALIRNEPKNPGRILGIVRRSLKREAEGLIHKAQGRRIVHLFHLGKTGGTAIKAALAGHEKSGDYEVILHDHALFLDQIPTTEHFAFVLRDPVTRFVSGFYSRLRQELPRHDGPWSPEEEAAFARFHTPNELALAISSTDSEARQSAAQAILKIRHIESPQWRWFNDINYFLSRRSKILFIGFLESLDVDFMLFKRILNLPPGIELPRDELQAHRSPADFDKRLDDEAIRNLKIWYRKDYEFLEVCKKLAAEIRSRYDSSNDVPTDLVPGADVIRR